PDYPINDWNYRIMTNVFGDIPGIGEAGIFYSYNSSTFSYQKTSEGTHSLYFSLGKKFLGDKLSTSIGISNILNSDEYESNISGDNFTQYYRSKYDLNTFSFSVSYIFGEFDMKSNKKKITPKTPDTGNGDLK